MCLEHEQRCGEKLCFTNNLLLKTFSRHSVIGELTDIPLIYYPQHSLLWRSDGSQDSTLMVRDQIVTIRVHNCFLCHYSQETLDDLLIKIISLLYKLTRVIGCVRGFLCN